MNLLSKLAFAVCATAVMAAAPAAQAQDWRLNPTYGTVNLRTGFLPDPVRVPLQSGGNINAAQSIGGGCLGWVAREPDVRLNYQAGSTLPLILSVASGWDTTLVVNLPDTSWACDDDGGQGLNPSLRFDRPMSGQYDIWVGSYGAPELHDAILVISELYSE